LTFLTKIEQEKNYHGKKNDCTRRKVMNRM
jgi:hypothetical protein